MSLFTRPLYKLHFPSDISTNYNIFFYKFSACFLQIYQKRSPKNDTIFACFWTASALITSKKNPKFSRASRAGSLLYFYKFVHEFLQISAPFSTNFSTVFYKLHFSTNFSMTFYKLHFSTNCIFKPRILLQMSRFSSTNVIFPKTSLYKFHKYLLQFFLQISRGGQITGISMVSSFRCHQKHKLVIFRWTFHVNPPNEINNPQQGNNVID